MARKLEQAKNGKGDAAPAVASLANFKGFDPAQLKEHVATIVSMADEAKEGAQPVKDEKARLKGEFGYNMKAFGVCIQMQRAEPTEARDMWLTIKAYAEAADLDNPDLVDLMGEEQEAA